MKRRIFINKSNNSRQKFLYLVLIGLAFLAFIFGILFIFMINKESLNLIKETLTNYIDNVGVSLSIFFKNLFNNYLYIIIIWILGISIIGIPIIILMFLFKYFLFGFSLSSIFSSFGFKGALLSVIELFPHKVLYLIVLLLITFYALSFSFKIFRNFFLKRPINFRESMNRYLKILLICLVTTLFISLYESFVVGYLINFFY